uniref:Glycosyltransferase n=1 Tax=Elaeis guineensis var. tenera TaxID=51953 RepID=A0A6I9QXY2_ELAGV|nr:LOW QUALITY PROTEIN: UDP-glycosyltransferase 88F3-like [Elaeis guineensis]
MKEMVVLYPGMGAGHLAPTVELAKLFLRDGLAVTVLVVDPPFEGRSDDDDSFIAAATASAHPSLSFNHLPISLPPNPPTDPVILMFDILRQGATHLRAVLTSLSETSAVRALVVDFFCTEALDAAAEVGIPSYIFFSSGAANIASFLYLPILHSAVPGSLKDLGDAPINFPGLRPIPASDMPATLQDRNDECYKRLLFHFERLPRFDGILINTFESLEPRAVTSLRDGVCLPGRPMTPTYCIGPLIADGRASGGKDKQECITWLDSQPKASAVFLCFGSGGSFSAEQLKEMATGLEKSGQRFLWVVRAPRNEDPSDMSERDLGAILPEGFLDRTKVRGVVVKSWAPQVEVLAHEAVGAFVTHCGWNSTLEGLCAGMPLIGWPLYAEQRMNKAMLVEELRLAVAVEGYDKGVVSAAEVEAKVKWVMESEGGEGAGRATAMAAKAKEAWGDGGSSQAAWVEFVKVLKCGGNGARE